MNECRFIGRYKGFEIYKCEHGLYEWKVYGNNLVMYKKFSEKYTIEDLHGEIDRYITYGW